MTSRIEGIEAVVIAVLLIAVVFVDIQRRHDRRRTDAKIAALTASEKLFRNTVDSLHEGVLIQKPDGVIVYINTAAIELTMTLGRNVDAVVGQPPANRFDEVIDESGRTVTEEELPRSLVVAHGHPVSGMTFGVRLDDAVQWLLCSAAAVDDGSSDGVVVTSISDVTTERRLTRELADQERRFRMALQCAPIGMALVSATGEFLEVNDAFCTLVGRDEATLLGSAYSDITHADDVAGDEAGRRALLDGDQDTARREKRYITPDGDVIHALSALAIVRQDQESYFIVQVVDIGERKQFEAAQSLALERERDAVVRLQELDRTKSDFVSTVSHELRTPLASVLGYLELLEADPNGCLTESQLHMIGVARRNSERLLMLIEDLLLLSAIETRSVRLGFASFHVGELVDRVVTSLRPFASKHAVGLCVTIDPSITTITADSHRIEQVIINLVNNGIKFTPSGGTVSLDVNRMPPPDSHPHHHRPRTVDRNITDHGCAGRPHTEWIEFRISDNGIGISDDDQGHLFTRFFRANTANTQAIPGTGLGLAIVSELVAAHGGHIHVDSKLNVGTTVAVHLPQQRLTVDA